MTKSVWLSVVVIATATVAIAAGGWFFLHHGERVPVAAVAPRPDPVAVTLKPFTVNLAGDDGRLLYVAMTLQAGNQATADSIHNHMAEVRNEVLMILSGQAASSLLTPSGKTALAAKLGTGLTKAMRGAHAGFVVNRVYFTQFIVQ